MESGSCATMVLIVDQPGSVIYLLGQRPRYAIEQE